MSAASKGYDAALEKIMAKVKNMDPPDPETDKKGWKDYVFCKALAAGDSAAQCEMVEKLARNDSERVEFILRLALHSTGVPK